MFGLYLLTSKISQDISLCCERTTEHLPFIFSTERCIYTQENTTKQRIVDANIKTEDVEGVCNYKTKTSVQLQGVEYKDQ